MQKYCEYSKYEYCRIPKYFKYTVFQSIEPQNTSSTSSIQSLQPRNTWSTRVLPPEILEVQAVPRVLDPEIIEVQAESREVLDPKILPVQAESKVSNLRTARRPSSNTIYKFPSLGFLQSCHHDYYYVLLLFIPCRGRPLSTVKKFGRTSNILRFVGSR